MGRLIIDPGRHARRVAEAYAAGYGHQPGRWDTWGICECAACGAALVDTDAWGFAYGRDVAALGSLGRPCPGSPAPDQKGAGPRPEGGVMDDTVLVHLSRDDVLLVARVLEQAGTVGGAPALDSDERLALRSVALHLRIARAATLHNDAGATCRAGGAGGKEGL